MDASPDLGRFLRSGQATDVAQRRDLSLDPFVKGAA